MFYFIISYAADAAAEDADASASPAEQQSVTFRAF